MTVEQTGRRDLFNMEMDYQRQSSGNMAAGSSRRSMGGQERELAQADYDYAFELAFPPEGSSVPPCPTPPHKLNFQFKFKV